MHKKLWAPLWPRALLGVSRSYGLSNWKKKNRKMRRYKLIVLFLSQILITFIE
uniref:Uncharacterized protein n=1 Tax=Meloidogyne enterolobii TaxID=390850 RepID=A0A6V7X871_MELEN|nr:unnamed protein product [Meloidogyne enterolobii]